MANRNIKINGNVEGKFYVDYSCIACETCTTTAPDNFRMKDDGSLSMVFKQPENEYEATACEDARSYCPTEAIGDDG